MCAGPHCSSGCFEPEFDHSRDASITSTPKRRGATPWNAGVADGILKCPDRLAPNDVSGVYQIYPVVGWKGC